MDNQPKTRRETKKTAKEKKQGKGVYSSKHVRQVQTNKSR